MRRRVVTGCVFLALSAPRMAVAADADETAELEYGATAEVEAPPPEPVHRSVPAEDLRKVAGARGDALRAVEILPGVARSNSYEGGAPVLRGAAQHESSVFLDGAPVPLLYHFASATSFFPSRLLERVDLVPSNFSVRYGRLVGGVIEARTREPARDRFHAVLDLSLLDSSALVESPVGKELAVAAGVRRSNIDFFFSKLVPKDAYSVVAAPVYYDYQAMGTLRLGSDHRLSVMAYGSRDSMRLLFSKPVLEDPGLRGEIEGVLAFHRLNATLASSPSREWVQRISVTAGTLEQKQVVGPLHSHLQSIQLLGRVDEKVELAPFADLGFGLDVNVELAKGNYYGPRPPGPEGDPTQNEGIDLVGGISIDDHRTIAQPGGYVELALRPARNVSVLPGLRLDWYGFLNEGSIDPRLSTRIELAPTTALKGGVGLFTQPPIWYETLPDLGNPGLSAYHALHSSVGVEQELAKGVKLGVEGYYKYIYDNVVASEGNAPPHFVNDGSGRVFGSELSLELRPSQKTFAYVAYSLSRSERRDRNQPYRLFDHDQTHVLSAVASQDLGRGYSIGGRFRLVSGDPRTPIDGAVYDARIDQYRPIYGKVNSERRPLFHQLDVRFEKEWRLDPVRLAAYVELLNAYNAKNEESTRYSYDYSERSAVTGLPLFPNLGLRGEL